MATAGAIALAPSSAFAQESPQALRQEIDQLRKDFDTLKQQSAIALRRSEETTATARRRRLQRRSRTAAASAGGAVPAGAEGGRRQPICGSAVVINVQPGHRVIGDSGCGREQSGAPRSFGPAPPTLQLHESRQSLQAVVDPYARADFFVSFGEESRSRKASSP
jgi:hypothetical protein